MRELNERLKTIKKHICGSGYKVMILGLGSVGTYLLDYLISAEYPPSEIIVVGRNEDKIKSDINIVRVAALIRGVNETDIIIESGIDFNNIDQTSEVIAKHKPDFLVNTSRVYSGLKYGSISWSNLRSYGIWSPLAIKYIRNIMQACDKADFEGIAINTSYSDATIPWLKSAGMPYPDLGSGNLNHLIPRIKYAVSELYDIEDFFFVDVVLATSHFHDVVISKEGHTEGVNPLLSVSYMDEMIDVSSDDIYKKCAIAMPTDAKRNMMNASSNFDIIHAIVCAMYDCADSLIHCPGSLGEIGGYPLLVSGIGDNPSISIFDEVFSIDDMRRTNRESIYLDGIENIEDGTLIYTDELVAKVKDKFGVDLPKSVAYDDIDKVAEFIIDNIIVPNVK